MTIKSELRQEILENYNLDINDFIPKDDADAWIMYPKYNFLYNKMFICKFQDIKFDPMPIYPNKYPVVIKPIINLMGMGLNAIKINNDKEFLKHIDNNHFWSECFNGEHISWDIILRNGQIIFFTCFKGIKNKIFGAFNYWKLIKIKKLPKIIIKLINIHLDGYTGCLNIETIGNKMIECHLRIGDADQLPKEYIRLFYLNYIDKNINIKDELSKLEFKNDIFMIPVWQKINEYHDLNKIYEYLQKTWENKIIANNQIQLYYFDKPGHAYPSNLKRWFLFVVHDYKKGYKLKKIIEKELKVHFKM
jgi:hypothetical protein